MFDYCYICPLTLGTVDYKDGPDLISRSLGNQAFNITKLVWNPNCAW